MKEVLHGPPACVSGMSHLLSHFNLYNQALGWALWPIQQRRWSYSFSNTQIARNEEKILTLEYLSPGPVHPKVLSRQTYIFLHYILLSPLN